MGFFSMIHVFISPKFIWFSFLWFLFVEFPILFMYCFPDFFWLSVFSQTLLSFFKMVILNSLSRNQYFSISLGSVPRDLYHSLCSLILHDPCIFLCIFNQSPLLIFINQLWQVKALTNLPKTFYVSQLWGARAGELSAGNFRRWYIVGVHGHAEILTVGPTVTDYGPDIEICMLIESPYLFFCCCCS